MLLKIKKHDGDRHRPLCACSCDGVQICMAMSRGKKLPTAFPLIMADTFVCCNGPHRISLHRRLDLPLAYKRSNSFVSVHRTETETSSAPRAVFPPTVSITEANFLASAVR